MEQIGNVHLFGYDQPAEYQSGWFEQVQNFQEKSGIRIGITPNPEKVWPGDQEMLSYMSRKNDALIQSGILNEEALVAVKEWKHVEIFTEFENLISAEKAFSAVKEQGVVDIYLYAGGILYDKFD